MLEVAKDAETGPGVVREVEQRQKQGEEGEEEGVAAVEGEEVVEGGEVVAEDEEEVEEEVWGEIYHQYRLRKPKQQGEQDAINFKEREGEGS